MTSPTPARVSGPGALSQRTDGGQPLRHISDAKYGEDKAFVEQQKGAPLAEASAGPSAPSSGGLGLAPSASPSAPGPAAPPQAITPFNAPTADPNQPVTAGMTPFGQPSAPPPTPELRPNQISESLAPYFAADPTGVLVDFAWKLSQMGL